MSDLQSRAKPLLIRLISAEPLGVDGPTRNLLIAWITMTVMVIEFTARNQVASTDGERHGLREAVLNRRLSALDGWAIAIGHYVGSEALPLAFRTYSFPLPGGSHALTTTSLRIGNLLVMCWSGLHLDAMNMLRRRYEDSHGLLFLAPGGPDTSWPPRVQIHDALADFLASDWRAHIHAAAQEVMQTLNAPERSQ